MIYISFNLFGWLKKDQDVREEEAVSVIESSYTAPETCDPESCGETEAVCGTEADESVLSSVIEVGCAQTIGRREDQEDAYFISDWKHTAALNEKGFLAVVADGIGGLDDGQVASGAAVKGAFERFKLQTTNENLSDRVLEITASAQNAVLNAAAARNSDCGCTFLCAVIDDMELCISSVGDSRIALYRNGVLLQLNREHVLARESDERMVLSGVGTRESERRRKAITAYLGKKDLRTVDRNLNPIQLISGDCVLLMSDGVFGMLNDSEIAAYLHMDTQEAAAAIIRSVLDKNNPGQDNATIVIVKIL